MKTILLFPFLLCVLLPGFWYGVQAQPISPQTTARIDSLFALWNTNTSPGAVVGVIHKGNLVFKQAYGMAEVRKKEKLTTAHAFWVASVAKQFTAMSIALLAEKGTLSLEDDIRHYLPELPYMGDTIRIKHLIYHTSGLRDGFTLIGMRFNGEKQYTNANVLKMLSQQQTLNFKPGSRHAYNNGGYVLLAYIVERASGQSFSAFTDTYIFRPLGMTNTHFYGKLGNHIPHLAQGYDVRYKGIAFTYRKGAFKGNTVGSSGLVTTLEDLYKWDQNFYHNRLGKASPELIKLLTTPGTLNDGSPIPYAFGLEVEPYKNQLAITHSGADEGYKAEIVRFPQLELTVYCLSNADNLYSLTHKLLHIGEWMMPDSFEDTVNNSSVEADSTEVKDFPGYYLNAENLSDLRVITEKNNTLHAARSIYGYQQPLTAVTPDKYANEGTGENSYQFKLSEDGTTEQVYYQERANNLKMQKVEAVSLSPKELKSYAGTYYSPELQKKYHLSVRRGRLGLRIFHLIHIPFQALEGDLFLADLMGNNSLLFSKNREGGITGFEFSREGVYKLKFSKQ